MGSGRCAHLYFIGFRRGFSPDFQVRQPAGNDRGQASPVPGETGHINLSLPRPFFAAWTFRSRNHFMGDGWLYISIVKEPFHIISDRPLDYFIHQVSHWLVQALGLGNGETAYAVLHCLLRPLFLWFCWRTADLVTHSLFEKAIVSSLMASTASLQLFAGYVECYTLLHLWIGIYLYAGIKYFQRGLNKGFPWPAALIFVLALLSHRSALSLAPSLIFLGLSALLSGRQAKNAYLNPS